MKKLLYNWNSDTEFITSWNITAGDTITLPLPAGFTYDFKVDWGDGVSNQITAYDDPNISHTYSTTAIIDIKISGLCEAWSINNNADIKLKLVEVKAWGNCNFKSLEGAFYGCSNLAAIPSDKIPAINITTFKYCFRDCEAITTIYAGMFDNAVNATTFEGCFYECRTLTAIPAGLFDNNVNVTSFERCFYICMALTVIPASLFYYNVNVTTFESCFEFCVNITAIPTGLFDNNVLVVTFESCFQRLTSLVAIPADLFKYNVNVTSFTSVFANCDIITSIPVDLFRYNVNVITFHYAFSYCYDLASIPADLFKYNVNASGFIGVFRYSVITSIPLLLFSNTLIPSYFNYAFKGCANINTAVPELWNTHPGSSGQDCFYGCTGAPNYASIPELWK